MKSSFVGVVAACCTLLAATPALAESPYLIGGGLYEHSDSDRDSDDGAGFELGIGLPIPRSRGAAAEFSLKAIERDRNRNNDSGGGSDKQVSLFGNFVKTLGGNPSGGIRPYVLAGFGAVREDVDDDDHFHVGFNAGAGLRVPLPISNWALRAQALAQIQLNDESVPSEDYLLDFQAGLALLIPLGRDESAPREPVPDAPECPVRVVDPVTGDSSCSTDSDKDGVNDGTDICPATPTGTAVDASGCTIGGNVDSDGDGVIDKADACPESPVGMAVDATGCLTEQTVTLRGVRFEPGSARLLPDARIALDEVARTLKNQRSLRVEISGHTDNLGNDAFNLLLSQQRAESVRQHLIGRGVGPDRLTAIGVGEAAPVAPNDTEEGRELNRRVEFKVSVP